MSEEQQHATEGCACYVLAAFSVANIAVGVLAGWLIWG